MTYRPLISIMITIYNAEDTLSKCLDSILMQTYDNLEIVIVDDGSTDGSARLIRDYVEKDGRIRFFQTENRGISSARNTALREVTGDWVTVVDRDDWIDLDCYERLVAELSPDLDLLRYNYVSEGLSGNDGSLYELSGRTIDIDQETFNQLCWHFLTRENNIMGTVWSILVKRELAQSVGYDDLLLHRGDLLFTVSVLKRSHKCRFVDMKKYHYFMNPGSMTRNPRNIKKNLISKIRLRELLIRDFRDGWTRELNDAVCRDQIRNIDYYLVRRYVETPEQYEMLREYTLASDAWKECIKYAGLLPMRYRVHINLVDKDRRLREKLFMSIYALLRRLR